MNARTTSRQRSPGWRARYARMVVASRYACVPAVRQQCPRHVAQPTAASGNGGGSCTDRSSSSARMETRVVSNFSSNACRTTRMRCARNSIRRERGVFNTLRWKFGTIASVRDCGSTTPSEGATRARKSDAARCTSATSTRRCRAASSTSHFFRQTAAAQTPSRTAWWISSLVPQKAQHFCERKGAGTRPAAPVFWLETTLFMAACSDVCAMPGPSPPSRSEQKSPRLHRCRGRAHP